MSGLVRSSEVNNNSSGRLSPLQSGGTSTSSNSYQNIGNRNSSLEQLSASITAGTTAADSCGANLIHNKENSGGISQSTLNENPQLRSSSTTFSLDKNEEFHFIKPQEVPTFKPNDEEFKNPLGYISKIRPVAEKFGIVKIKPPKTWTPPFAVDVDKLRFTPRVQRLNELEAKTRVKLNFLDQIAKFWELQGSSLKIPQVERRILDLYTLHRVVQEEGGMEQVTRERKWSKVSLRMGYPPGKNVGATLRSHYERILHPYNIFTSGKVVDLKLESDIDDTSYRPHRIISRQQITPPNEATARRSKRFANSTATCGLGMGTVIKDEANGNEKIKEELDKESKTKELRRLQIYGAGPKMAGYSVRRMGGMNGKKKSKVVDPLAKYICYICNRGDAEESMLLCDGCDDSYHMFCLIPPLIEVPKGDWRCPKCIVEEVSKPQEAFGFEQASREYTLQQFGEMADQFKADYFNMAVHLVPTDLVEREFWRIVSSIDEDVTVEYGADLHTLDHGSGFPTKESINLLPGDKEYAESSWNLNNLPLLEESILGHINADISGMKVPWMYVGMCFATFCWHNEDHWSYSINYLHWGEPKTWYGVPGSSAEAFEETMKSAAPELFHSQPDLLHQLVTIMNPNILMKSGVPVYRTDQHAGEFVVTFPRAYHAGFNQGYNFAEAVNFAPADWLKMGRECINHYSMLRRFCVFSHDELVCKMALDPDKLNLGIATACYLDMTEMVESEKKLRKSLLEWGVTKAERQPFELIPDDERQCESCKTTIFLSAVSCTCSKAIVCLRHYTELCDCSPENHTLKYRYTLDELPLMLKKLKVKAESFENWLSRIRNILDPNTATTITLEELQELAQEAEEKKFPNSVLLERLKSAVLEAEKCVIVIQQLDINKVRTRSRNSGESAKYKLSLEELELFVQEIDNLCCIIKEGQSVRELLALGKEFVGSAKTQLIKPIGKADEKVIERLIDEGTSLCIELHEIKALKDRQRQVNWYNRIKLFRESQEKKTVSDVDAMIKEGLLVTPDSAIEKQLVFLHDIIASIEDWELLAAKCLQSGSQHDLSKMELLIERADEIQGILPTQNILKDAIKKTKEWLATVEILQANENYPYFHTLENVVTRGKNIPFQLEELKTMEEHLESARHWKERAGKKFLKKESALTLIDVLSPRTDALNPGSKAAAKKRNLEEHFNEEMDISQVANFFKNAADKELEDMRELRKLNAAKNPEEDKFCVCKRKVQGQMYQCQLCKDWFHKGCVSAPRNIIRPRAANVGSSSEQILQNSERDTKYLCDICTRSRRPHLQTVLSLLVSLQRVPIRLPEGEALQHLTERAMQWQDRARQAIETEDVALALKTLSTISQKLVDSGTDSTVDNKKSRKKSRVAPTSTGGNNSKPEGMGDEDESLSSSGDEELSADSSMEHTYSVPMQQSTPLGINTNPENSNSNRIDTTPLIHLSKDTIENLEELMMEGDLLEVSLDETSHIWRILSAARTSTTNFSQNVSKKRRLDDSGEPSAVKRLAKISSTKVKVAATKDAKATNNGNNTTTKRKRRGRKAQKEQQEAMTSDEDDECSATVCEKPSGREVDWIQCDGECNQWFHMFCVGLDKNQVKPEDDYVCKRCEKMTITKTTSPTPIASATSSGTTMFSSDVITITSAEITTLPTTSTPTAMASATATTTTITEVALTEESASTSNSTTQQLTLSSTATTT